MTEALPDDDKTKKKKKKVTLSSMEVIFDLNWSQLGSIDLNGHSFFSLRSFTQKKLYCSQDSLYYSIITTTTFFPIFISFLYLFISVLMYMFIISALYIPFVFQNIFHIISTKKILFSKNIFSKLIHFLLWCILYFVSLLFLRSKRQPPKYKELLMKIKSLR